MALTNIEFKLPSGELPADVRAFHMEAERRVGEFVMARQQPVRGFVPCCFETVFRALREISVRNLAAGDRFCEWGSGMGVAASMAAKLGFQACGIEIESDLCQASRDLALHFDLPVEFVTGSFIPAGSENLIDRAYAQVEGELTLDTQSDDAYDQLELDICDFDIIFAYPWPNDAKLTAAIFNKFASSGALLVTYHGNDSIRLQRKNS